MNAQVARDAGFAYEAYVRLKLASVRAFVARLIVKLRGVPMQSPLSRVVAEIIDVWAERKGIVYDRTESAALQAEAPTAAQLPGWVKFLLAFDVQYRERRLHFLIEGQNRLYQLLGQDRFAGLDPGVVDRLKRDFYGRLDALRRRQDAAFFSPQLRDLVADIFPAAPSAGEVKHLPSYARLFVEQHARQARPAGGSARRRDRSRCQHARSRRAAGDARARPQWHPDARREVIVNYLGFPFWDVLTFPVTSGREIGEFNEILVDRISPQDVRALKGFDGIESLKGVGFGHFAAFLSRAYRENDYLLGRLHALDRLIDIVCDSAGIDPAHDADRRAGAEAAGFQPDPRRRGKAPGPQPRADRGAAALRCGDEADVSRRTPATARRRPKSSPPPPTTEYPPRWSRRIAPAGRRVDRRRS